MSNTQSEGEVQLFRDTLTKLERLVDVRENLVCRWSTSRRTTEKGIIYLLKVLTELDVNNSESNAIEELERLVVMENKTRIQSEMYCIAEHQHELSSGKAFDEIIDAKINFIRKGSFSRLISRGGVEPIAALERLVEVQRKYYSKYMDGLLESRIKEFLYAPKPEASLRSILSYHEDFTNTLQPFAQSTTAPTVCPAKVVAAPVYVSPNFPRVNKMIIDRVPQASQKQENPKRDPSSESEESKTTAKFVSSPLSWLQDQNQVHTKGDDDSTEDGEQLTPTSTIISGGPGY